MRRAQRGSAVAESLVAAALVAVALAGLASTAAVAVRSLALARDLSTALALGAARLEALRAGPRLAGDDVVTSAGTSFTRRWTVARGRGLPTVLTVAVEWRGRRLEHTTEALP